MNLKNQFSALILGVCLSTNAFALYANIHSQTPALKRLPGLSSHLYAGIPDRNLAGTGGAAPSPQSATPIRIRVDGEEQEGKLISRPEPEYSGMAQLANIQGKVRLTAVIGKDGTVLEVKTISGHPLLVVPARKSVLKSR